MYSKANPRRKCCEAETNTRSLSTSRRGLLHYCSGRDLDERPELPLDHGFESRASAPCELLRCIRESHEWGAAIEKFKRNFCAHISQEAALPMRNIHGVVAAGIPPIDRGRCRLHTERPEPGRKKRDDHLRHGVM